MSCLSNINDLKKRLGPLLLALLLSACQKSGSHITALSPDAGFPQLFDYFWSSVSTGYVYWDTDTTDWDRIHQIYAPLFARLDRRNPDDVVKSAGYFRQMTGSLKDGHFQLIFHTPPLAGLNIYPSAIREQSSTGFHLPFNYEAVDSSYFDPGYLSVYDNSTPGYSGPLHAVMATIQKKYLYFSCSEFHLSQSWTGKDNPVKRLLDTLFSRIANPSFTPAAFLIDVRNNNGGDLVDLRFLLGHFITRPLHFGYSSYKSGPGRLEYTPWIDAILAPSANARAISRPIVVLTDRYTVSLGEAVAMAVTAMPNGLVIGERTWGATGPVADREIYNAGSFDIPGFMTVYMASARFNYIDGRSYEDTGFPPDIAVPFSKTALNKGTDPVLDTVLSRVR